MKGLRVVSLRNCLLRLVLGTAIATAHVPQAAVAEPGPLAAAPRAKHASAHEPAAFVPGEVIVRFASTATPQQRADAHRAGGAVRARGVSKSVPGLTKAKLPKGKRVNEALAAYRRMPGVLYAQPNYRFRAVETASDPDFGQLWALHNEGQTGGVPDADIDAPEAWQLTAGSDDVVVAVLDSGIDYTHPEFAGNLWTNPGEVPDNAVDDDGNGFVDDVYGADTVNGDGDPFDDHGHGTHVAGTIGARANNGVGVAGVNWNVKIMAIKILDADGYATTDSIVQACDYLAHSPARLSNNSWGGTSYDQAQYDAIAAVDKLFVFSAGNKATNTDVTPHYPSGYDLPHIVSVGASDASDTAAAFSNYGAQTVDLFAPGVGILSTEPGKTLVDGPVVFSDPFDTLDGWSPYSYAGYGSNPWVLSAARYVSPSTSAANVGYGDDQVSGILMGGPGLSLGDKPGYKVEASIAHDLETYADFLFVGAGSDQQDEVVLGHLTGSSSGSFVSAGFDLTRFKGDTGVRLFAELYSDGSISSTDGFEGVYVDDVIVREREWAYDYPNAYRLASGTSMAAPHVTGVAALVLALDPAATPAQLKQRLLASVDTKDAFATRCATAGRLNAASAVASFGSLSGMVTAHGQGIGGVEVRVDGSLRATTTPDGAYHVTGLLIGPHEVSFTKPGFGVQTIDAVQVSAGANQLDATLIQLAAISGKVTDAGLPVAGVLVSDGTRSSLTDSAGRYALSGIHPGAYTVSFTKAYYAPRSVLATVAAGQALVLDAAISRIVPKATISCSPASPATYVRRDGVARYTLSATFKGWSGKPLAGRTVYLQKSPNGTSGWVTASKLTTSSTGKASKYHRVTTRGTRYYRWFVPAKSGMNKSTYSSVRRVIVK